MPILLIDYGASRIKSALYDQELSVILKKYEIPSCAPITSMEGKYEILPISIEHSFNTIINEYNSFKVEAIYLCSEMHGFILVDAHNKPVSNYISWKDERDFYKENYFFNLVNSEISDFEDITGLKLRNSLPVINVLHLLGDMKLAKVKMFTLSDYLASFEKSNDISNDTIISGLGFYDINEKKYSDKILDFFTKRGISISFNEVSADISIAGYIKNIPIYTGVGDLQCALYGSDISKTSLSLNLGTGSQVSTLDFLAGFERRPFFKKQILYTTTHIPSGRAFNAIIAFLDGIIKKDYWQMLASYSKDDILNSSLKIDLSFFSSAYGYTNGGSVMHILENNFTLDNFLKSCLKAYIFQYVKIINLLKKTTIEYPIIISGGIPQKLPVVVEILKEVLPNKIEINSSVDETLIGMIKLYNEEVKNA